jgi:uncharacterized membrane-anchored protein YhcB (DUF1043 family)
MQYDLPDWLKTILTLVVGAGGVGILRVWLESRRLGNQDVRQTLMDRIDILEANMAELHQEIGALREENAVLKDRLSLGSQTRYDES